MQIKQLSLTNFRNYKEAQIPFYEGIHILHGANGAGKTSILEAIHYLALTKSFRAGNDKYLIHDNESFLRVAGVFKNQQGREFTTAIAYSRKEGKQLSVNQQKASPFSEYIGEVPLVLLHPADLNLSQGGPVQRRRFLDVLLSQSSKLYLHNLIQYNRSLRQRNLLLQADHSDARLVSSWEENLVNFGVQIIQKRQEAVQILSKQVKQFYQRISRSDDKAKILYRSNVADADGANLAEKYRTLFKQKYSRERDVRSTIVGPHRDDLLLLINGRPVKSHASQGEHKSLVIALKLAEYHFLKEQQQQPPILLFDDLFGELDAGRIRQMLRGLSQIGQVFVTTTSRTFFDKVRQIDAPTYYYQVDDGRISRAA